MKRLESVLGNLVHFSHFFPMNGESCHQSSRIPSHTDVDLALERADDTMDDVETPTPTFALQEPQTFFLRDDARVAYLSAGPVPL